NRPAGTSRGAAPGGRARTSRAARRPCRGTQGARDFEQAAAALADAAADTAAGDAALDAQIRIARLRLQVQVDARIDTDGLFREAKEAIDVLEGLGDDRRLAKAWELMAWVPWFRCHAAEADAALERAIAHARRAGDGRT